MPTINQTTHDQIMLNYGPMDTVKHMVMLAQNNAVIDQIVEIFDAWREHLIENNLISGTTEINHEVVYGRFSLTNFGPYLEGYQLTVKEPELAKFGMVFIVGVDQGQAVITTVYNVTDSKIHRPDTDTSATGTMQ